MPRETQPDAQYIKDVHQHLVDLWQPAHTHWEEIDQYINGTFPVWDASKPANVNRTTYHPSTAAATVRKGAATQLAYEPKVHRQRRKDSDDEEKIAGGLENGMKAVLDDASLQEILLPYKMLGIYGVAYGYFILGSGLDRSVWPKRPPKNASEDAWEDYKRAKGNANPFRVFAPHPSTVLMPLNTKRPKFAVSVAQWLGDDLEHATRIRGDRPAKYKPEFLEYFNPATDRFKEVEVWELWTPDWHALMLGKDMRLLFVEKNTWGFVPYMHAIAGFSQEFTGNNLTLPEQLAQGMLSPVLEGIRLQAQRVSAEQDLNLKLAYSPLLTNQDPAALRTAINNGIGGGSRWTKDSTWWLEYPNVLRTMSESGSWVDNDIQAGTYRRDLSGERQPGVATVGQQVILSEAAMRDFSTLAKQIDYVASGNASQIAQLADILGEEVTIGGHTLNPKKLNHDYNFDVRFELIDQIIQMQQTEQLMTAYDKELVTAAYVREHGLRIEDEAGMRTALTKERINRMPIVQMMNDAETARDMDNEKLAVSLERQAEQLLAEQEAALAEGRVGPDGSIAAPPPGPEGQVPRQPLTPNTSSPAPRQR